MQNKVQRVTACDESEPSNKIRNSFVLIAVDGEEKSVLWVPRMLLLFHLNFKTDLGGTRYASLQYMEFVLALNKVDKEFSCVCLQGSTTDKKDHSVVTKKELNNRTSLNVGERFRVQNFCSIRGVMHVV